MFEGHAAGVLDLFLNLDDHLFSASADHCVMEWDVHSGTHVRTFEAHSGPVTSLFISSGELFTGSSDGTIGQWQLTSGQLVGMYNDHHSTVTCVVVAQGTILSGSDDGTIVAGHVLGQANAAHSHRNVLGAVNSISRNQSVEPPGKFHPQSLPIPNDAPVPRGVVPQGWSMPSSSSSVPPSVVSSVPPTPSTNPPIPPLALQENIPPTQGPMPLSSRRKTVTREDLEKLQQGLSTQLEAVLAQDRGFHNPEAELRNTNEALSRLEREQEMTELLERLKEELGESREDTSRALKAIERLEGELGASSSENEILKKEVGRLQAQLINAAHDADANSQLESRFNEEAVQRVSAQEESSRYLAELDEQKIKHHNLLMQLEANTGAMQEQMASRDALEYESRVKEAEMEAALQMMSDQRDSMREATLVAHTEMQMLRRQLHQGDTETSPEKIPQNDQQLMMHSMLKLYTLTLYGVYLHKRDENRKRKVLSAMRLHWNRVLKEEFEEVKEELNALNHLTTIDQIINGEDSKTETTPPVADDKVVKHYSSVEVPRESSMEGGARDSLAKIAEFLDEEDVKDRPKKQEVTTEAMTKKKEKLAEEVQELDKEAIFLGMNQEPSGLQEEEETRETSSGANLYKQFAQDAKSNGRAAGVEHEDHEEHDDDDEEEEVDNPFGIVESPSFVEEAEVASMSSDERAQKEAKEDEELAAALQNMSPEEREEVMSELRTEMLASQPVSEKQAKIRATATQDSQLERSFDAMDMALDELEDLTMEDET